MKSHHLWATLFLFLFLFSSLPLCFPLVQKQTDLKRNSLPKEEEHTIPVNPLPDGQEIQADIPSNSHTPVIFLYKPDAPTNLQPLVVTVRCPEREIIIYARRIPSDSQHQFDYALNEQTAEVSSLQDQSPLEGIATISVPPLAHDPAVVVIAVYFNEIQKTAPTTTEIFTILASSKITHLFAGTQFSGSVAEDHYVYFMVPIMRSECTVLISLTNLDDGADTDLVVSYDGSKVARPTISDHQFASIPHLKTELIEINNDDIYPRDSMSGNLIIGVYGNTATSFFTLTVLYQEQKINDLTLGIPAALESSSSANFKFLHESNTGLQVQLKKFSGELNLYMNCLNSTQNPASHLPGRTSHQWQISPADSQSSLYILAMDLQACFPCTCLINIEAISLSKFELLVNEVHKKYNFAPLKDGSSYAGQLKPQESAPFVLKTSIEIKEAELMIVDLKGGELAILISKTPKMSPTTYLWEEIVPSDSKNHTVSLTKGQDTFYILLHNPTNNILSYNFTLRESLMVNLESFTTIELQGDSHVVPVDLTPHEKISFLYYSDIVSVEKIMIEITQLFAPSMVKRSTALNLVETALSKGQIIKGKFLADKKTPEKEIFLERLAPKVSFPYLRMKNTQAVIQQTLLVENSKGKYIIEVTNPWDFTLKFSIEMKPFRNERQLLGENLHYETQLSSSSQQYDILMTKVPAKWYFWLYSCDEDANLAVKVGQKELSNRGSYLYKEAIEEEGIRTVAVTPKNYYPSKALMFSALVNESKLFDYELKGSDLNVEISYNYNDEQNSQVTVNFKPVEFQDPDLADKVKYEIQICSLEGYPEGEYRKNLKSSISFCGKNGFSCQDSLLELPVNHKESIMVKFEGVKSEEYFVKVKATVVHQGQMVRFVPYNVGFVEIKSKIWPQIFLVGIGALLVLILWAKFGCGKLLCCAKTKIKEIEGRNGEQEIEKETEETESLTESLMKAFKLMTKNHRE